MLVAELVGAPLPAQPAAPSTNRRLMKKSRPRASSVGASPSKEGLSTHLVNRSTWKKAASKHDKKVRYNPIDSAEALEETIAAHDPYLEKEDPPMSDKIDTCVVQRTLTQTEQSGKKWSEPLGHESTPSESLEPPPTPPNPGDCPQPDSRG